jgi:hypothetical protein
MTHLTSRVKQSFFTSHPTSSDLNKKARLEVPEDTTDANYKYQNNYQGNYQDKYQEHSMKVVVPNTKVGCVIGKGNTISCGDMQKRSNLMAFSFFQRG